jgi:hypothetical protein
MTTLKTQVPDTILRYAKTLAEREKITLDQFVSMALASQISSWQTQHEFAERAKRGSWDRAREILAKGGDLEPAPEDKL